MADFARKILKQMLPPRYLDGLSDEITEIYSQLETDILQDMARRLARLGKITDMTKWQAQMLAEAGGLKKNIGRILAKYDKAIVRQIKDTFTEALETNARNDNRIFKEATGRTISAPNAQAMLSTIQKCHSDLSRLTLTTATTTQTQFVREANRVYMNVQSGAFDYDTAMKDAADKLSKRGITTVQYENGRPVTRSIESAVRMNILTSINQTAANQTLNNAEEVGVEKFEVTAHIGARPEHEAWQDKVYTKSQLETICGLGDAAGLCGINCRHSFYPYFEGMDKHCSQNDMDEMAGEKVSYNGKDMTRYEGEQKLRGIERNIRHYKRQALTQEAAGADSTKARRKIGEWQAAARDFTKQTGIARDSAREYVGTSGKQPIALKPVVKENLTTPKPSATTTTTTAGMNRKSDVFIKATRNLSDFVSKAATTQTMTPTQQATVVQGKNLVGMYNIKQRTEDIKEIVQKQGFDGKPTVLAKDDFIQAVKDDTFIAQRTYTAGSKAELEKYIDMLRNGDFYVDCRVGGKAHGKGMYAAADYTKGTALKKIVSEMENYQQIGMTSRGEYWIMIETLALKPDAKIIDEVDVKPTYLKAFNDYWKSKGLTTREINDKIIAQRLVSKDIGVMAAELGYDAIRSKGVIRSDYMVILNRTKVILLGGAK